MQAMSAVQQRSQDTTYIPRRFCFIHLSGRFCPGWIFHSHRCPSCGGPHPVTKCHTQPVQSANLLTSPFANRQGAHFGPAAHIPASLPSIPVCTKPDIKDPDSDYKVQSPIPKTGTNSKYLPVTPINVHKLTIALRCVQPRVQKYLIDGFTNGFRTGFSGESK